MIKQFGTYERILLVLIFFLILFYAIGKPLCVACLYSFQKDKIITGNVEVRGFVASEPQVGEKYQRLLIIAESPDMYAGAKALLFLSRYQQVGFGDFVAIRGTFEGLGELGFQYKAYLERQGIGSIAYYPSVVFQGEKKEQRFFHPLFINIRSTLRKPVLEHLPERQSALILAMTLGETWRIPHDFSQALSRAGIIHMVSISGLHMAIITSFLLFLFILLGLGRQQATIASLPVITFYLFLVESPAPALRSAMMGIAMLFAFMLGRGGRMLYILFLSAFLMLVWDIRWLFDIGFQLSFMALLGITLLYPEIRRWFTWISDNIIKTMVLSTFAVELTLFPIIGYYFGSMSLVSPLTNILLLPVAPAFLIISFIVEITGFFWQPLWLIGEYHLVVISFLGNLPFSSFPLFVPVWMIPIYYVVLFGTVYYINYLSFFSFTQREESFTI